MDADKIGVHETHCCPRCLTCKYNDEDCPVVNGTVRGLYTCDSCDCDEEQVVYYMTQLNTRDFSDIIKQINDIRNGGQ
jgi:hypothetical protein